MIASFTRTDETSCKNMADRQDESRVHRDKTRGTGPTTGHIREHPVQANEYSRPVMINGTLPTHPSLHVREEHEFLCDSFEALGRLNSCYYARCTTWFESIGQLDAVWRVLHRPSLARMG